MNELNAAINVFSVIMWSPLSTKLRSPSSPLSRYSLQLCELDSSKNDQQLPQSPRVFPKRGDLIELPLFRVKHSRDYH